MDMEEYDCIKKQRVLEMITEPFLERYAKEGWKLNKTSGFLQQNTDFGHVEIVLSVTGYWPLEQLFCSYFTVHHRAVEKLAYDLFEYKRVVDIKSLKYHSTVISPRIHLKEEDPARQEVTLRSEADIARLIPELLDGFERIGMEFFKKYSNLKAVADHEVDDFEEKRVHGSHAWNYGICVHLLATLKLAKDERLGHYLHLFRTDPRVHKYSRADETDTFLSALNAFNKD